MTVATGFNAPQGITTDGTSLYVADTRNHTIMKMTKVGGGLTTIAGTPPAPDPTPGSTDGIGSAASFFFPWGLTTDGDKLYVVDSNNNTIRAIQ